MSQSVELKAVAAVAAIAVKKPVRKIKIKAVAMPVVAAVVTEPTPPTPTLLPLPLFNKSVWLLMRRTPKEKPLPIVWEHVEDISDDEEDTPQAAGKRLSQMKATKAKMQRRDYENQLDELQRGGLFLNWAKPKLLQTHENYDYDVISTRAYPVKQVL
jgi:hypothetical protein